MAVTKNRLTNQPVWIGSGLTTLNDSTLFINQLGMVFIQAGLAYQLVQAKATTSTIAAGTPLGWTDEDDFVVSAEFDDLNRNLPAGVAIGTITAGSYGWIQVQGPYATIVTDGLDYAAGDTMILGNATDGQTTRVSAGTATTYRKLAIATGTYAGSVTGVAGSVAGVLCPDHNGW